MKAKKAKTAGAAKKTAPVREAAPKVNPFKEIRAVAPDVDVEKDLPPGLPMSENLELAKYLQATRGR